jgi:hypothetical protein
MGAVSSGSGFDPGEPSGPPPGQVAGFALVSELGHGSFTTTHRVRRHSLDFAMKILDRETEERRERLFLRTAALLAAIDHPGLPRVHQAGVADGRPYMVMDFVDGRPLAGVLGGGRLAVQDTIRLGIELAGALGAAHRARLVHADLRPDHILLNAGGDARLVGFGHVAAIDHTGTYRAPELAATPHEDADGRADLYALGAVLYECVIGQPPPGAGEHPSAAPDPQVVRPELPPALSRIITKLLARDPDHRYQTADGLVADLWRLASGVEWDFPVGGADRPAARPDPPLLGRDREVVTLLQLCHQARAGVGGAVLVLGPAGSGKSRLAGEVTAAVRLEGGGLMLRGECEPDEGVPLAPLRRAIDDHLRAVAGLPAHEYRSALDRVRAAAGPAASLLRGLTLALDDVIAGPTLVEADRHQQFLVAVADFLAALATSYGGGVLYLDDVQWMDAATSRVLQLLAGKLTDAPLLMLLTGRDDARGVANAATIRSALGRESQYREMRLQPLPADVVARLISAMTAGLQVDTATAATVVARSDGNTFTLLQYLDALIDAGLLQPDWGHWRLDLDAASKLAPADDGIELILRRLDGLDADSRSVLGVGAVHGVVFDYHLVADACGLPRHRVLDVVDTAAWRDLVERRTGGRYAFRHDRIREALVAQYAAEALQDVHQRIGDALAGAGRTDAEAVFALARHCVHGQPHRDPRRAVRACHAAGRLALADHAPVEAVRYLEFAEQVARTHDVTLESALLTALATAQQRAGRFLSAARTARAGLDRSSDPIERARLLALIAQSNGAVWEGEEESDTILAALGELGRRPARAMPLLLISTLWTVLLGQLVRLTRVGDGTARDRAREAYQVEASLYRAAMRTYALQLRPIRGLLCLLRQTYPVMRIGPGPELAHLRSGLATFDLVIGLRRTGRRNADHAVTMAGGIGDPTLTGHIAWMDAFNRHSFGIDQGEALRTLLEEQSHWLELGARSDLILVLLWDALHRGDLREAQRLAERRETLIRSSGEPDSEATAQFQSATVARGALAALYAWLDRPEASERQLHGEADARLARWERLPLCGAAIVASYQRNDLGETFDRVVAEFDALNLPVRTLIPVGIGFFIYRAQGRVEQARLASGPDRARRLRQARAALRLVGSAARIPLQRGQLEVTRAALLQAAGNPQAALRRLAQRDADLAAVDAPSVTFDAARVRALALRDCGDTARSDEQARVALTIAEQQGWPQRVRQLASDFPR